MKLLFVTQVMDSENPELGFVYGWVSMLAKEMERVEVICLYEGAHEFPENVTVYSLGKEKEKRHTFVYALRFLRLAWRLRKNYDKVFVHMNQEYLLLAGVLWKVLGKRMYLWRNHYSGNLLTDIAASFCTKVFCTSRYSYTVKYNKTLLMPVGVDVTRFSRRGPEARRAGSILFFTRISPSKRVDVFIEALGMLHKRGVAFSASVYGSPIPSNEAYYTKVKDMVQKLDIANHVIFHPGVPNTQAPAVFRAHDIFVNCSPSGMFDKMLFEASASGCIVVAQSKDWEGLVGDEIIFSGSPEDLSQRLEVLLVLQAEKRTVYIHKQDTAVEKNSLNRLLTRLVTELS